MYYRPRTDYYSILASAPGRSITEYLGEEQETLSIPDESKTANVSIKNFTPISSYDWIEAAKPTIIVPGSPPYWSNRPLPFTLARDSDSCFTDQNGHRCPSCPLEPLLRAVIHHQPDIELGQYDIVTDRNNLRKLMRWTQGATDKDFRIDIELVGKKTVLLSRWEATTKESARPGYGHRFEVEATTPAKGSEKSTGHHRIISYDLNNIKMLVRFKIDACIRPRAETTSIDDLAGQLSSLSVASPTTSEKVSSTSSSNIRIISSGTLVPHSTLLELKTRSRLSVANFDWVETWPQLFLSQTPYMYLAVHERGCFSEIQKMALGSTNLAGATGLAQPGLKKLQLALQDIIKLVVKEGKKKKLSLVCRGGVLKVYERSSFGIKLPEDLVARFDV